MENERFTKKKILIVATIGIVAVILVAVLLLAGEFNITQYLDEFTPPIMIVMGFELSIPVLFIVSFFTSDTIKKYLRVAGVVILVGLVGFYFYIPFMPIDISPNHPDEEWDSGSVVHILPAVTENRFLIKTSYEEPVEDPQLLVGGIPAKKMKMDTYGYFWGFDAQGLTPDTTYTLTLQDHTGNNLCDIWTLKTYPSRTSSPESVRIVSFTGSGGHDACRSWFGTGQMPLRLRKKIMNRALSFNPDILVGTGDQIYYDIKYGATPQSLGMSRRAVQHNGKFDFDKEVWGTKNEEVLKNAVDCQISYLYGTAFRSTPTYFIFDDHDYFVNDEAREKDSINFQLLMVWLNPYVEGGLSLPPKGLPLKLGRAAQKLYLPEFLPDQNLPKELPYTNESGRFEDVSECFGALRYGDLLEGVFYDTRRLKTVVDENGDFLGEDAVFIPKEAEDWLIQRMTANETEHVINFSPISYGWSAGKWGSWYPDVKITEDGKPVLTKEEEKYAWQEGWYLQHNRILGATQRSKSTQLFVCGDMHTQTAGWITRSGTVDLTDNPVASVLVGSLGANGGSYPSGGLRGIEAAPPVDLEVTEELPSYEKSGFVVMDITRDDITITFYGWRMDMDRESEIETLESHFTFEIPSAS
ncbi:MAG: conserved membrane protein of unknown function [Promethearchaeota archaeon]|nr:MAG: conserved membrane protein of unknown function [Candidatus Lokiarchaeota archaeon]